MNNFEIIESLSKTSAFKQIETKELVLRLKENLQILAEDDDHLSIRECISQNIEFADAQTDIRFNA